MTDVIPISQSDQRLEDASRWALKLDEGLSPAEYTALEAWLSEHPKNATELIEVAGAWDKLDSLTRLADLFPIAETEEHAKPTGSPWRARLAAVASVVLVVTATLLLLPRLGIDLGFDVRGPVDDRSIVTKDAVQHYETAIGEQSTVLLADGSEVVLNTNSELEVLFSESARVLQLSRGEIHITVAKDPSRPLSVVAGDRIVQAIGTSFSVEITDTQHVEVMVTEGKVVVGVRPAGVALDSNATMEPLLTLPMLAQSDDNTVTAGEALILGEPDAVAVPVTAEEIAVKLSWREGRLIFRSEPLENALAEVERYTLVEFVLLDDDLKTRTVSGRFRAGDVDALLVLLELNFNISHQYDGERRVLLSSL